LDEKTDAEMLILKRFQYTSTQEGGISQECDGWVFSCKAELLNIKAVLDCTNGEGIYVSLDGTHKLLCNGWVLINLISETLVDSHDGKDILLWIFAT
jgi:hypothetical protein